MILTSFENSYTEIADQDIIDPNSNGELAIRTCIDGFPANEEDDEKYAEVVAAVLTTIDGNTIVEWHDNGYRLNETVNALINESIEEHKKLLYDYKNGLEKSRIYGNIYRQLEEMEKYKIARDDHEIKAMIEAFKVLIDNRRA